MKHFRTIVAVVEVHEDTDFRYPGHAMERARKALEAEGFTVARLRNEPNETGELPERGGVA